MRGCGVVISLLHYKKSDLDEPIMFGAFSGFNTVHGYGTLCTILIPDIVIIDSRLFGWFDLQLLRRSGVNAQPCQAHAAWIHNSPRKGKNREKKIEIGDEKTTQALPAPTKTKPPESHQKANPLFITAERTPISDQLRSIGTRTWPCD
jgi:hypothetical protein